MAHAIALHIYFVCKLLHGFKQLKVLAQKSLKYHSNTQELVSQGVSKCKCINPLPTKANCFRKQESMYKVLTPNIKPPI